MFQFNLTSGQPEVALCPCLQSSNVIVYLLFGLLGLYEKKNSPLNYKIMLAQTWHQLTLILRWKSSASRGEEKRRILPSRSTLSLHGWWWNPRKVPIFRNSCFTPSNSRLCRMFSTERSWVKEILDPSCVIVRFFVERRTNSVLELEKTDDDGSVLIWLCWGQSMMHPFQNERLAGIQFKTYR